MPLVTPIQSESEATRKRRRPGVKWVAGDVFPSRESNSNDTPELVKSIRPAGRIDACLPGGPGPKGRPWRPPEPREPTRRA